LCCKNENPAKSCSTFTCFPSLPIELRLAIIEYACIHSQTLLITAEANDAGPEPETDDGDNSGNEEDETDNDEEDKSDNDGRHAQVQSARRTDVRELKNTRFSFQLTEKTPHGLVLICPPSQVLGVRLVTKDYSHHAIRHFFGKSTFEIHDASASFSHSPRNKGVAGLSTWMVTIS
jgi:hypothetical protein